jgi:hypothetical protein
VDSSRLTGLECILSFAGFVLLVAVLFSPAILDDRTVACAPFGAFTLPEGPVGCAPASGNPFFDSVGPAWIHEANLPFRLRALRAGSLPFWNPHEACGNPYLAGYIPGLFFPPNWLMLLAPSAPGIDLAYLARLVLGGWLLYLFLRVHGLRRTAAFLGGLVFLGSGRMLTGFNLSDVSVECLTPGLLLAIECLLTRGRRRDLALTVLMALLVLLAGNPQAEFIALAIGGAYAVFRLFSIPEGRRLRGATLTALALVLAAVLAAPQLVPFLDFVSLATHSHTPDKIFVHPPLESLVVWVAPAYYLNAYGARELASTGGFFGLATLAWIAAAGGLFVRSRKRGLEKLAVPGLLLVAAWYYGVPGIRLLDHLPLVKQITLERYLLAPLTLFPAILAGVGLHALAGARSPARSLALGTLAVASIPALFTALWAAGGLEGIASAAYRVGPTDPVVPHLGVTPVLVGVALLAALAASRVPSIRRFLPLGLVVLALIEVRPYVPSGYGPRRDLYRPPAFLPRLEGDPATFRIYSPDRILAPNTASIFGLNDIRVAENLVVDRYYRLVDRAFDLRFLPPYFYRKDGPPRTPVRALELLGVRYVLARGSPEPLAFSAVAAGARRETAVSLRGEDHFLTGTVEGPAGALAGVRVRTPEPRGSSRVREEAIGPESRAVRLDLEPTDAEPLCYLGWMGEGRLRILEATWCGQPLRSETIAAGIQDPRLIARPGDGSLTVASPAVVSLPAIAGAIAPELTLRCRVEAGDRGRVALVARAARAHDVAAQDGGRFRVRLPGGGEPRQVLSVQAPRGSRVTGLRLTPAGLVKTASHGGIDVYRNTEALPRAYGVFRAEVVADPEAQLARVLDAGFSVRDTVVLERRPPAIRWPEDAPSDPPIITAFEEDPAGARVTVRARFPRPGLLVLLDNHFPGWEAFVDGELTPILRANYAFRAVSVPAGSHEVRFTYRPRYWLASLLASALALLALIGVLQWGPFRD